MWYCRWVDGLHYVVNLQCSRRVMAPTQCWLEAGISLHVCTTHWVHGTQLESEDKTTRWAFPPLFSNPESFGENMYSKWRAVHVRYGINQKTITNLHKGFVNNLENVFHFVHLCCIFKMQHKWTKVNKNEDLQPYPKKLDNNYNFTYIDPIFGKFGLAADILLTDWIGPKKLSAFEAGALTATLWNGSVEPLPREVVVWLCFFLLDIRLFHIVSILLYIW